MSKYAVTYTIHEKSPQGGNNKYYKARKEIEQVLESCGFKKEQPETLFVTDRDVDAIKAVVKLKDEIDKKAKTFKECVDFIYIFRVDDFCDITKVVKDETGGGFSKDGISVRN